MADEILIGSGGGLDILQAEAAAQLLLLSLADRDASLLAHPAIAYLGDANRRNSDVLQVPIVALDGADMFTSRTEIEAGVNTPFTTAQATMTLGRWNLSYIMSDMVRSVDGRGILNFSRFAESIVNSLNMTMVKALVDLVDGAATGVSLTGAKATWSGLIRPGAASLTVGKVPPPYLCVLHPTQFEHVREEIEGMGGSIQMSEGAQRLLGAWRGVGYQGNYNGIDFITSSEVDDSGGIDWKGAIFGQGFIGYMTSSYPTESDGAQVLMQAGPLRVELVRTGKQAMSEIVANALFGVGEMVDLRGRYLISRNTL